jgi:hypothetical protein
LDIKMIASNRLSVVNATTRILAAYWFSYPGALLRVKK